MKGADVAMSTIVQYNDWLEEEVRNRIKNVLKKIVKTKNLKSKYWVLLK